jgi:putative flavoprotein involved in K+ transport
MASMMTAAPDQRLALWLSEFDSALSRGDIAAATDLFLPDGFWRDVVAFTWNIHTAEGRDAIRGLLEVCLAHAAPSGWAASGPARLADGVVEATLTFETSVARGNAVVRLKDGRCWTLLTAMTELKGHEEAIGLRRPRGMPEAYSPGRPSWRMNRDREAAELGVNHQPYCLVVGAGHAGLALGARLKRLGVPTLLVDKQDRPSDTWRHRYEALTLHSPVRFDEMPYMAYPESWPVFRSKDQMADWLDAYARLMELDIWTGAECRHAVYDGQCQEWRVEIQRGGQVQTVRPRHLVFASGLTGTPSLPRYPGMETFRGEQHHAAAHRGGPAYKGRRCVVVGASTSAHDISAALWEAGAHVTMVQRAPTIVARLARMIDVIAASYSDEAVAQGITTDKADLLFASLPLKLLTRRWVAATAAIRQQDAEFYDRLEQAGFLLTDGEDGSGLLPQLLRRASGTYIDVGASALIADGRIGLRAGVEIREVREHGVVLSDGSELPADVIVYATGFVPMADAAARILSEGVMQAVGPIYGPGSGVRGDPGPWEGEQRGLWKPTGQNALWFHGGNLNASRFYSRALALQIKARHAGLPTPVHAPGHQAA